MRNHGAALAAFAVALAAVACGGTEKTVVDQYFNAVKAKDNQTLSSFAAVTFDKPVESWKITRRQRGAEDARDGSRSWSAKVKDLEAQLAAEHRRTRAPTSTPPRSTRCKALQQAGKPCRPTCRPSPTDYDKFDQKDQELKKAGGRRPRTRWRRSAAHDALGGPGRQTSRA